VEVPGLGDWLGVAGAEVPGLGGWDVVTSGEWRTTPGYRYTQRVGSNPGSGIRMMTSPALYSHTKSAGRKDRLTWAGIATVGAVGMLDGVQYNVAGGVGASAELVEASANPRRLRLAVRPIVVRALVLLILWSLPSRDWSDAPKHLMIKLKPA